MAETSARDRQPASQSRSPLRSGASGLPDAGVPTVALSHYADGTQRRLDLINRSLHALRTGRLYEAYLLADISCRSRVPAAADLLLRGEIASRLGFNDLARADLREAFACDPSLPQAQLRMLASLRQSGDHEGADGMARDLLRLRPQAAVLSASIAALRLRPGAEAAAWARADRNGIALHLFCASSRSFHIDLAFQQGRERLVVQTHANHAFAAALGTAASVAIAWPTGEWAAQIVSDPELDWVGSPIFRPLHTPQRPKLRPRPATARRPQGPVAIIIPIYSSLARTRVCIESVLAGAGETNARAVLVDDRGPGDRDPAMCGMLADYAARPGVTLTANPVNLGFIGSVNRALIDLPDGDVVLLNADTIVAPGWLDRLAQAAYSRSDIGTVTPLSNHGELTSVPAPFARSPLPSPEQVAAVDAILAQTQRGRTLELPNGVGFCLYITEACRRATGLLNDVDYVEGYLEEVDFCLRASELGFSHLCACDVFVGHAGAQSFKARKRGLVGRNLSQLQREFPTAKAMTHSFVRADPLRSVRADLQESLLAAGSLFPCTLVIGRHAVVEPGLPDIPAVAARAEAGPLLRLSFGPAAAQAGADRSDARTALLHRDEAMAPWRLALDLSGDLPAESLLRRIRPSGVESILYLDADHPDWARLLPRQLDTPYDVHMTDDGILAACRRPRASGSADWPAFLSRARSLRTSSLIIAAGFARLGLRAPDIAACGAGLVQAPRRAAGANGNAAVFLDAGDAKAWRWLHGFARRLVSRRSHTRLIVFGETLDDDGLRRTGVVTVTGRPDVDLAAATFALHRCGVSIALLPQSVCEHPALALMGRSPRPILSWNPYLADVLGCGTDAGRSFTAAADHDEVLDVMMGALRCDHGPE